MLAALGASEGIKLSRRAFDGLEFGDKGNDNKLRVSASDPDSYKTKVDEMQKVQVAKAGTCLAELLQQIAGLSMEPLTLLTGADRWFFSNRVTTIALDGKGSAVGGIGREIVRVAELFDEVIDLLDAPDLFARFEKEPKVPVWVRVSAVSRVSPPTPARNDGIKTEIGVGGDAIRVTASVEEVYPSLRGYCEPVAQSSNGATPFRARHLGIPSLIGPASNPTINLLPAQKCQAHRVEFTLSFDCE